MACTQRYHESDHHPCFLLSIILSVWALISCFLLDLERVDLQLIYKTVSTLVIGRWMISLLDRQIIILSVKCFQPALTFISQVR